MDHLSSTNLMCAILLLFYASGTVKGAGFDEACGDGNECTGTNIECSSSKCACTSASFRNKDNDQCIPKIVLEATCVDGEPAGQCADDLAECRDDSGFKCLCKAANYKSGSACTFRKAPGATCASGECVANAICSTTCTCNTGYKETPSSCESFPFDAACDTSNTCTDANTECSSSTSKCVCTSGSFRKTDGSACVTKVAYDATCVSGEPATQCADSLAECRDDSGLKCLCTAANFKGSSVCEARKAPGATCASGECVTNAMCNTTCTCNTGYTATPTTTPTSCESSDASIIIAHKYVFIFGIVASLYFLV